MTNQYIIPQFYLFINTQRLQNKLISISTDNYNLLIDRYLNIRISALTTHYRHHHYSYHYLIIQYSKVISKYCINGIGEKTKKKEGPRSISNKIGTSKHTQHP